MSRFLWIPICFFALAVPVVVLASGGSGSFDGVVRSIESRYSIHATRIPFLGLVSLIARKSTHEGVGSVHVAEFDNLPANIDSSELNQIVEDKLGKDWERVVRETSRRAGGEQTLIFARPEGDRMGLFIVDKDGAELNVVQVSVDPGHLDESIGQYTHHHDSTDGESD